jgi:hypothetical protein
MTRTRILLLGTAAILYLTGRPKLWWMLAGVLAGLWAGWFIG